MDKTTMVKIRLFFLILVLLISCCQSKISKTCEERLIFENQLKLVQNYLDYIHSDSLVGMNSPSGAIYFFENVTGISSESETTMAGKLSPKNIDYILWNNWYLTYQDSLCEENYRIKIDSAYKVISH